MTQAAVIIPNLNGLKFLKPCLASLAAQSFREFETVVVDNGSTDGSVEFIKENYPEVRIHRFEKNTGFCKAVNEGIRITDAPVVILLNNDTVSDPDFVGELVKAMKRHPDAFSCGAQMLKMHQPELIDNAGDCYCALGWAFARGQGKPAVGYEKEMKVFTACAGAAAYSRAALEKTGLFDEKHFAYFEDVDIGWRARIHGYENYYVPSARVRHVGSGSSGSAYNEFKVRHASRNSVYIIRKNMPALQVLVNLPFLLAGFLIKTLFFTKKGFGRLYLRGLAEGLRMHAGEQLIRRPKTGVIPYLKIQLRLWAGLWQRIAA